MCVFAGVAVVPEKSHNGIWLFAKIYELTFDADCMRETDTETAAHHFRFISCFWHDQVAIVFVLHSAQNMNRVGALRDM